MHVFILIFYSFLTFSNPQINVIEPPCTEIGQTYFCEGWEDGYKDGYCYGQGYGCLEPLTPLCPLPRLGEDSYKGGYNRGFLNGLGDQ